MNAAIYGVFGVRIVDEKPGEWVAVALDGGVWLVVKPCIPKSWERASVELTVNGKKLAISGDQAGLEVVYDGKNH